MLVLCVFLHDTNNLQLFKKLDLVQRRKSLTFVAQITTADPLDISLAL